MPSIFYKQGADTVLQRLGLQQPEESGWRKALPWLGGAAGTAALYGLLRRVRLSKNPALRKIQEAAKGKLTGIEERGSAMGMLANHAPKLPQSIQTWLKNKTGIDDIRDIMVALPTHWQKRLLKLTRGVDDVRFTDPALEAELEPILHRLTRNPKAVSPITPEKIEGGLFNFRPPEHHLMFRGSANPTGNVRDTRLLEDKALETRVMQEYMPEVSPKLYGTPKKFIQPNESAEVLQQRLQAMHPEGYIIKPRFGAAAGDVLTNKHNLQELAQGGGQRQEWITDMLKKPDDYIVQSRLPILTEKRMPIWGKKYHPGAAELPVEYRVHTVGGRIIPGAMIRRYPTTGALNPFKTWLERRRLIREIQPQFDKLPAKYRDELSMALDVAKTSKGFKLIETNPGGQSGFLAPDYIGIPSTAPHQVYKAITGRTSKPMAVAKALTGGGAIATATGLATGTNNQQ